MSEVSTQRPSDCSTDTTVWRWAASAVARLASTSPAGQRSTSLRDLPVLKPSLVESGWANLAMVMLETPPVSGCITVSISCSKS